LILNPKPPTVNRKPYLPPPSPRNPQEMLYATATLLRRIPLALNLNLNLNPNAGEGGIACGRHVAASAGRR
jgi:hypothetical protein